MTSLYINRSFVSANATATCDNCGWKGPVDAVEQCVEDAQERIHAGEITPAGECPECSALAWLDVQESAPQGVSADALEALNHAEAFIAGFEGDENQEGVDDLLFRIRCAQALPITPDRRDLLTKVLAQFLATFGAAVDNDEEIEGSSAVDYLVEMVGHVRAALADSQ